MFDAVAPSHIGVDLFDTVLVRRVAGDGALWWIVGSALIRDGAWSRTVGDFVQARRAAAAVATDGTLQDVYAEAHVAADGNVTAETEYAVERCLTVPVPGATDALRRLRAAGHRLTFVSDMHLSRTHLWRCLTEHDLAAPGDVLVISSESGASKWKGTLFSQLAVEVPVPLDWYIGNDLWSDVAMAERAGLRAVPLRRAEPTALERLMAKQTGSVGPAIASAALRVRCDAPSSDVAEDALWELGADVAGQCLAAFLLWIREQCDSAAAKNVLFLARDGELPLRMAEAMLDDHWDGLELTYLHGSRRLWSIAAADALGVDAWLAAGTADALGFLRQGENDVPWGAVLSRAALTPKDLSDFPRLGELPIDQPLPAFSTPAWHALLQDPGVRRTIAKRAARQHEDLRQHLRSQGIGHGRVVVVDVGWRGQLAWHVSATLRSLTGFEPVHLHFGGVDVSADEADEADIRRFAFDDSRAALPFGDVVSCVETLTASGGPRARALERRVDGSVDLVFEPALPAMDTDHRRLMWRSAVEVARALPSRAELREWNVDLDGLDAQVRDVLSAFWLKPSKQHALAAAHLAAEVDDSGATIFPVASAYTLPVRRSAGRRTWRQGSLRLTSPLLRAPLLAALRVRDRRALARAR